MSNDTGIERGSVEVNPLAPWMREKRVRARELAEAMDVATGTVRTWKLGQRRPNDAMKLSLAKVTLAIEEKLGIAEPRGVPVLAWFAAEEKSATDERDVVDLARAAG